MKTEINQCALYRKTKEIEQSIGLCKQDGKFNLNRETHQQFIHGCL